MFYVRLCRETAGPRKEAEKGAKEQKFAETEETSRRRGKMENPKKDLEANSPSINAGAHIIRGHHKSSLFTLQLLANF